MAQTVKNLPAMQEDWFAAPGQEDPLEKGWNPLQYSCLENPMDRGAWRAGYSLWVGHNLHLALAFYCLRHFLESAVYQVLCLLRIYAFVCLGVGTEGEPLPTFKIPLGTCSVGHTLCLLGIQPSWVSRAVRNEPGACSLFPKEHWTSVEHL